MCAVSWRPRTGSVARLGALRVPRELQLARGGRARPVGVGGERREKKGEERRGEERRGEERRVRGNRRARQAANLGRVIATGMIGMPLENSP